MNTDQKKRVLVIEDDQFLCGLLVQHFNAHGLEAYACRDAESGLESIKKELPDLLLLDLLLPSMDGFQLLEKLKELDIFPSKLPVIILSNLSQQDNVEQGKRLGVVDFLGKSNYDLDEITKKIREVVG